MVCEESPELADAHAAHAAYLETSPAGEAEERYTPRFDLSPVCTLHVGYHLFGETYQRGAFLAGMSGELRSRGLAPTDGELADHLAAVLRLLARVTDADERETLVDRALLPALQRMSVALGDSTSPWTNVIRALPCCLERFGSGETLELALPSLTPGSTQEVSLDA
jgi:nitrate reductase delta subunit